MSQLRFLTSIKFLIEMKITFFSKSCLLSEVIIVWDKDFVPILYPLRSFEPENMLPEMSLYLLDYEKNKSVMKYSVKPEHSINSIRGVINWIIYFNPIYHVQNISTWNCFLQNMLTIYFSTRLTQACDGLLFVQ